MTLMQLKYAIKVSELNSFNGAAKALFMSQSSISTAIKDLEEELGINIFNRTNHGISITSEGAEFIHYARNILLQVNALEDRYTVGENKKRFSITMHHSTFATRIFSDVVNEFGLAGYEYSIYETQTDKVIEDLEKGKSELGILYLSEYNRRYYARLFKEHGLEFKVLAEYDVYVYLGKNHPLAGRESISLNELEEYPCLIFDQGNNSSFYFYEEIISAYQYKNIIRTSDRGTTINLLSYLNGYSVGIGILTETDSTDNLTAVRLETDEKIKVGYLLKSGVNLTELGKRYLEIFTEYVKSGQKKTEEEKS